MRETELEQNQQSINNNNGDDDLNYNNSSSHTKQLLPKQKHNPRI